MQISLFDKQTPRGTKQLRDYQNTAVQNTLKALAMGKNPVIALPTGSGKSLCIAALCESIPGRILVATHRKELLKQNADELAQFAVADAGIYSAGLAIRDTATRIVFGGIHSIYRRMSALQANGDFGTIIVDEAHLCGPRDSEGIMYAEVFKACASARRIGLSATPYRLNDGPIWGNNDDTYFDILACEVSIRSLTPNYLAPLRGILTAHDIDLTGARKAAGEYILSDMSQIACEESVVDGALDELCSLVRNRRHWLIFCIDVAHTELVTMKLQERGIAADMVIGRSDNDERDDVLGRFKSGELRALVNCLVATTGFNIPSIDVIAMLRPTMSRSLVIQMIGRGSRRYTGKHDCVILDFAGNIERHAPLDDVLANMERSPARQVVDAKEAEEKAAAEAKDRKRTALHDSKASTSDPFALSEKRQVQQVLGISYAVEKSKKYPHCQNIVVTYRLSGPSKWVRQWLCVEYPGGSRWHAMQFFKRKGLPCPTTAQQGIDMLKQIRKPATVLVDRSEKYPRIIMEHFEEREPEPWQ